MKKKNNTVVPKWPMRLSKNPTQKEFDMVFSIWTLRIRKIRGVVQNLLNRDLRTSWSCPKISFIDLPCSEYKILQQTSMFSRYA